MGGIPLEEGGTYVFFLCEEEEGIFRLASDYLTFFLVGKKLYHGGDAKKSRLSLPELEKIITSELQNRAGVFDVEMKEYEYVSAYRAAHPNENKYEAD